MSHKIKLPLHFFNIKELDINVIEKVERVKNQQISVMHGSKSYGFEYNVPMSILDFNLLIKNK